MCDSTQAVAQSLSLEGWQEKNAISIISDDDNESDINGDGNQGELGICLCVRLVLDRENSFMPNEASPRSHTKLKSR